MAKLLPDGPIDTVGVRPAVLGLPEQLTDAGACGPVDGLPATDDLDHVVIVAPGAVRTAADVARILAAPVASIPVVPHTDVPLPAYVSSRSLIVVLSVDDHPAAIAAASAARERAAPLVVIAPAGSTLAGEGRGGGAAVVDAPVDVPLSRLAVGPLTVHLLAVLEQLGQYAGTASAVSDAAAQLGRRRDELAPDDNAMARLARRIGRTLPIFYGTDELSGAAAAHWKRQVNLSAKAASFSGALPAIGWDEIAGWGQHGDMTRQVFTMVSLRHDHEPPGAASAMDLVDELVDEVVHERHRIDASGDGPLAQFLDLVFQGDLLSWHLAQELEIDPGPTAAIAAIASRS